MKILAMCSIFVFGLSLSACSHTAKHSCCGDKGACSMEHKSGDHKDCKGTDGCGHAECPMKKS
ncbi:hypothetical protein [Bdellovibrio sp. HCB337]|uniref:hypothetical protein n=1 Tax=Bdellovibrio sp. HCB337 TaxID=3394358 RepID=UPI0039A4E007